MRKKKSALEFTQFPNPGLIVVQGSSDQAVANWLADIFEDAGQELANRGYFIIGAPGDFEFTQIPDETLKQMGLKRVKRAPLKQ